VALALSDNPVAQSTAPPPRLSKIVYASVVASAPDQIWQIDLFFRIV
jgi:hypothetical protein